MVKLIALRLVNFPAERTGSRVIAIFDCEVSGIELLGVDLIKTRHGGFSARLPRMGRPGEQRGVRIPDCALHYQITAIARGAYRAMGGTEAEWTPSGSSDQVSAVQVADGEAS